jgi:hypothetical protein
MDHPTRTRTRTGHSNGGEHGTCSGCVPKEKGPAQWLVPFNRLLSAFGNDRRRGFALADILRTASDAKESQHRGRQ